MPITTLQDFVIPVLKVLDKLGGSATIPEIHKRFFEEFGKQLDPAIDWQRITHNNNDHDVLWQDQCGTRVAFRYLRRYGYITTQRHGRCGSVYLLTNKGRAKACES